jgi:hypothetical protein
LTTSLSEIRERVHRKSHQYFAFDSNRIEKAKRNKFYGATDALLDTELAASNYGRIVAAFATCAGAKLLACYGFLQVLYVQQDAVRTLSDAVGLKWHPNDDDRLKFIRDTRNRLSGHPASAAKSPRTSSAIIPDRNINPEGFRGHVYYDDGFADVEVTVESFLRDNEERLTAQMREIEAKMDDAERRFRIEEATRLFSSRLEDGFSYLLQRLHCELGDAGRVPQAQSHAQMIREVMIELQRDLAHRRFGSTASSHHIDRLFTGLNLLGRIMERSPLSLETQHEFDLIYDGVEKNVLLLKRILAEIDKMLCTPVL